MAPHGMIGRVMKLLYCALVRVANLSTAPNRLVAESVANCVYGLVKRLAVRVLLCKVLATKLK